MWPRTPIRGIVQTWSCPKLTAARHLPLNSHMHSLDPEIRQLYSEGILDDATATRAIALERGEVFSVHHELRLTLYAGVLLVTSGVGTILARHFDRIGPLTIVLAVALAAMACFIPALRAKRADRALSTAGDYLLLLGVLLVSADLGYVEHEFQLLGPSWSWHLLLLALFHAAVAYAFRSSLVLAASLTALAGWFGVASGSGLVPFEQMSTPELGARALACAAAIGAWRCADSRRIPATGFSPVFEHFATNLAFWSALAWCHPLPWLFAGLPLLAVVAGLAIRHGLESGREAFVVYGVVYSALGLCFAVVPRIHGSTAAMSFVLLVVCIAAAALWQLRQRVRESGS